MTLFWYATSCGVFGGEHFRLAALGDFADSGRER